MLQFNRSARPLLDVIENYGKYDLLLDSVDDYVQLGGTDSFYDVFQIASTYTVEIEIEIPSIPAGNQAVWNGGVTGSNRHGLIITSTGYAVFGYYDGMNYTTVSQEIEPGSHHIACVNNEGSLTLYVDGVSNPGAVQTVVIGSPSRLFRLGQNGGSTGNFGGRIRDARLWNVTRTQQQIQDDIGKYLIGNEPGLVGLWMLQEGAGRIAYDRTQYRRNGWIVGAVWAVKA